jgi:hypothetical protein
VGLVRLTAPADPAAEPADPRDDTARLLEFLRGRDAPCPGCGYNLRDLQRSVCPECRHDLVLAVGLGRPRLGWLLAATAPGIFSGIAAALLLIPIVTVPMMGGVPAPWFIIAVDAFGWASGLTAVGLIARKDAFMHRPFAVQRMTAIVIWAVHVAAFLALVLVTL